MIFAMKLGNAGFSSHNYLTLAHPNAGSKRTPEPLMIFELSFQEFSIWIANSRSTHLLRMMTRGSETPGEHGPVNSPELQAVCSPPFFLHSCSGRGEVNTLCIRLWDSPQRTPYALLFSSNFSI